MSHRVQLVELHLTGRGDKISSKLVIRMIKNVSVHTRWHVAAKHPWDMLPQHFHVCTHLVAAACHAKRPCYMSPQCAPHTFSVAATCRCIRSLQHEPSCLPAFNSSSALVPRHLVTVSSDQSGVIHHRESLDQLQRWLKFLKNSPLPA